MGEQNRDAPRGLIPAHAGKTPPYGPSRRPYGAHPRSRGENRRSRSSASRSYGSSPLTRGKLTPSMSCSTGPRLIPAHAGKTPASFAGVHSGWAHPRSRGENHHHRRGQSVHRGSSPLTRGKHALAVARLDSAGLIPAHAGKTAPRSPRSRPAPAHPRSRGENNRWLATSLRSQGSSPLTRGKRRRAPTPRPRHRLIPAHAGKTTWSSAVKSRMRAHPRSRGENLVSIAAEVITAGSSPLTRGKRCAYRSCSETWGLIPAHAGKTSRPPWA